MMYTLLHITLVFLVILLITLVEAVTLTLQKWAAFVLCLAAAFIANLVSTLVTVILLSLVDQVNFIHLFIGFCISIFLDSLILFAYKRQPTWRTIKNVALANLASYLILILPAFTYGQKL